MTTEYTPETLLAEERELTFQRFDEDDAWLLGCLLRERAREGGKPVAIEIACGGRRLFACSLPGASPDNEGWIRRKVAVVERFHHATLYMRLLCESKGTDFNEKFLLDRSAYAAHGGAFPLLVAGVGCVGSIAVSGLPQLEDHAFLVAGLRDFLRAADRTPQ